MSIVRALLAEGWSVPEVSRLSGIPVQTVRRWSAGGTVAFGTAPIVERPPWRPADESAYAYLLGVYLGDGTVSTMPTQTLFRIALDSAYPGIIHECCDAMRRVVPLCSPRVYRPRPDRVACIQVSGHVWREAFPQRGRGKKHTRPIVLAEWQRDIVDEHPEQFLRGLIHSDGCRTVNRFQTKLPSGRIAEYEYPRYFFSNLSPDIRALFGATCDQLGIRWTQSNARNISISHRKSVARLDEFVGPKA